MKPELDNRHNDYFALLCPNCGDSWLHHEKVDVFERKEDEEKGLHVTIKGSEYFVDDDLTGNPSSRRNGLKVGFYCEMCDAISTLSISQHKGNTFVSFDFIFKSQKEKYLDYLKSPEWDEKRKSKLKEAGFRCQLCNSQGELHVHHRTYARILYEIPEDLIVLCSKCHEKFHDHLPDIEE